MGWFGPRGLASVVFTLLAFVRLEQAGRPIDTLEAVATWTILLSVPAHGLSAQPLAAWYARRLKAAGANPSNWSSIPRGRSGTNIRTLWPEESRQRRYPLCAVFNSCPDTDAIFGQVRAAKTKVRAVVEVSLLGTGWGQQAVDGKVA
jgi:hypothetical protein